jgi:hypothetical protein
MEPALQEDRPVASPTDRLDAVAAGARRGREFLLTWATATDDAALARTLRALAARAASIADACAEHLDALGTPARPRTDESFEARLAIASSGDDDACFRVLLGEDGTPASDPECLFDAGDDDRTAALLRRYVDSERDAEARLRAHRDGDAAASPSLLSRLDAACAGLRGTLDPTTGT